MASCIYSIKNTKTGKLYLGRTVNSKARFSSHLCAMRRGSHANICLQNSFNLHGESAFVFDVMWEESPDNLEELEGFILDELFTSGKLYNISKSAKGGDGRASDKDVRAKAVATRAANGHKPFSDETRQMQRDGAKARVFEALDWAVANSETRDAALKMFSCSWGGLKKYQPEWEAINGTLMLPKRASGDKSGMFKHGLSKEIRRKRTPEEIIERRRKQSDQMSGENNPMHGRKHTDAARKIQSESAKKNAELRRESGYIVSEETGRKISNALKDRPKSLDHRRNMAASRLGKRYSTPAGIFATSRECEEATGVKAATIMWRCKNNYQQQWTYA